MYARLHRSKLHRSHKLFTNKLHICVCKIGSNNFVDVWNKLEYPRIGEIHIECMNLSYVISFHCHVNLMMSHLAQLHHLYMFDYRFDSPSVLIWRILGLS
jgi:hypothetical protein